MDCSPIRQTAIPKRHLRRMTGCCPMILECLDDCQNCSLIRLSHWMNHCPTIPVSLGVSRSCCPIHYSRTIPVSLDDCQNCSPIVHLSQNPTDCRIVLAAPHPTDCSRMIRVYQVAVRNCCPIHPTDRCRPMDCFPIRQSVILIEHYRHQSCCLMIPNCRSRRMNRVSQIGMGLIHRNYCLGWLARCRDGSARQNPVNAKQKMARRSRSRTCLYAQRSNPVNSRQGDW
jgi:hypothetical protein